MEDSADFIIHLVSDNSLFLPSGWKYNCVVVTKPPGSLGSDSDVSRPGGQ